MTRATDVQVLVIGAGVMGLATAWALSKAGADALLLERFEPGHDNGSSHGATRIFRFAYDDPWHVGLAQRSLPLWRELEDASKQSLLSITGGIDFGSTDYLNTSAAALRSMGAAADILSGEETRKRFPNVDYENDPALYSPDTGVLAANRCVSALLAASRIPIKTGTTVERLEISGGGVTAHTGSGSFGATTAIVTAGAWTSDLLETIGLDAPLEVSREQIFYFNDPAEGTPVVIERGPIMRYLLPKAFDAPGAKAGEHGTGIATTAIERSFEIEPEGGKRVREWIRSAFPAMDPNPVSSQTCLYTLTPDEQFVIDRKGPVVFASPCSGHGFKFAPLIGEALAAMVTGGMPPFDPEVYSLARFGIVT